MGQPDTTSQQGIDELRNILLGDDRRAMDTLRARLAEQQRDLAGNAQAIEHTTALIEQLRQRVGDDEQLRQAMVPVLSQAIADVEKHNPQPLSRALSPFIVSSIRREIANSKEAMVEALYPITGKLVSAAVKNAVASMMESINQRVDEATSARMISARFKAWRSGEPVSAYLMPVIGEVDFHSALLMERDTGAPICHVDPAGEEPQSDGQANLVSGLLAALSNLTEEVFTGADDELRTLDLNGRKITLRRSHRHLLVVEFVGTLSAEQHRSIDERFGEVVSLSQNGDQRAVARELTALLQLSDVAAPSGKRRALALWFGLVALAFVGWLALSGWQRAQLDGAADDLKLRIAANPAFSAYPIAVRAQHDTGKIAVNGLVPESFDPIALRLQWQDWVQDYPLEVDLAQIADAARTRELEQELKLLHAENRILRLRGEAEPPGDSLRSRLESLVADQRFVIGIDGMLVDDGASRPLLRRVARLLVAGGLRMQVVGLVPEARIDDDAHAVGVAKLLRELGVGAEQLEIAVQPSSEASRGGRQVILEVLGSLP